MSRRTIPALGAAALLTLALAACGGAGAGSASPAAEPAATSAAPAVAAPPCVKTAEAGTVIVSIKDFAFAPAEISAKVGDVIAFTNDDTATHTATLLDGGCSTEEIAPGTTTGLTFSEAGSYPFQCRIHTSMTGTITVS